MRAFLVCTFGILTVAGGECRLQSQQVGAVKVGMTVAQARKALPGTVLQKKEDAEQLVYLAVMEGGQRRMDIYPDADEPRTERATIVTMRVYDRSCSTADGVHPGMPLAEVAAKFGPMVRIERTEVESTEYAEFARQPLWLEVQAGNGKAGVYAPRMRCTAKAVPGAIAESLWVSKPLASVRHFENDSMCKESVR